MPRSLSPLRYPGGKTKIYEKVKKLIEVNELDNRTYVEPFAGGFGIGIALLCGNVVKSAVLNDFDSHIYHFWSAVFFHTDDLLKKIIDTPITLKEREKQNMIYSDPTSDDVSDGYATLFLNRVNFSGIITGGPLGGLSQSSAYKIDCRFNKREIAKKIERIALLKDRVELYNYDARKLITIHLRRRIGTSFFYIDPPYVLNGRRLYANYFNEVDHRNLARIIAKYLSKTQWVVTYDDCDLIHEIYTQYYMERYGIQHNAGGTVRGKEIVISNISKNLFIW
jgi:DNA adenine methylase